MAACAGDALNAAVRPTTPTRFSDTPWIAVPGPEFFVAKHGPGDEQINWEASGICGAELAGVIANAPIAMVDPTRAAAPKDRRFNKDFIAFSPPWRTTP